MFLGGGDRPSSVLARDKMAQSGVLALTLAFVRSLTARSLATAAGTLSVRTHPQTGADAITACQPVPGPRPDLASAAAARVQTCRGCQNAAHLPPVTPHRHGTALP